jgi:hypothetical protein
VDEVVWVHNVRPCWCSRRWFRVLCQDLSREMDLGWRRLRVGCCRKLHQGFKRITISVDTVIEAEFPHATKISVALAPEQNRVVRHSWSHLNGCGRKPHTFAPASPRNNGRPPSTSTNTGANSWKHPGVTGLPHILPLGFAHAVLG